MIGTRKIQITKSYLKQLFKFYFGFLRQITPEFNSLKMFVWGKDADTDPHTVPKIIWIYWHDKTINSNIIQLCIKQIKTLHVNYQIQILNTSNLKEWLPNFPNISHILPMANVSDLIRLMLLEKYGGIYLDASVLLFRPLDWVLNKIKQDSSEAFLYYTEENTGDSAYPVLETWCLAAVEGSKFIRDWREEYQACLESENPQNYYTNYDRTSFTKTIKLDPVYHKCYFACHYTMKKSQSYRLSLARAEDDGFLYSLQIKSKWSDVSMSEILLMNKKPRRLPNMIKIVSDSRRRIDNCLINGFYKKASIFNFVKNSPF